MKNQYLEERGKGKKTISKYYEIGSVAPIESSAIVIIVGGIIGVLVALVKEYWVKEV